MRLVTRLPAMPYPTNKGQGKKVLQHASRLRLCELRILQPQASIHLEEKATGIEGRVRRGKREHLTGKVPYLGVEWGQCSCLREACDVPLRRSTDLSEGSAYVNLVVCDRDLEDLRPLTAGHVRVEAGHLSARRGIERGHIVARCSTDAREVPA